VVSYLTEELVRLGHEDPSLEEFAAMEFEPLAEDDRVGMYKSLANPQWTESTFNLGVTSGLRLP